MGKIAKTLKSLALSRKRAFEGTKVVFIPFFGRIGDAVMFLDALAGYEALYDASDGYRIVLGCRNEVRVLLEALHLDERLTIIELTRERLSADESYFEQAVKRICEYKPDTVVHVREYNSTEDMLLCRIPAAMRISCSSYERSVSVAKRLLVDAAYDRRVLSSPDEDQMGAHASLLRELGHADYRSKVAIIPELPLFENCPNEPYVVVCVGASTSNKCWPADRFAAVIEHLISIGYKVVMCGAKGDRDTTDNVLSLMADSAHVTNLVGETSFVEWVSTIQHAELVIANESGAIHLAAACRTPSICIAGQTYGDKWLPYRPEVTRVGDCLPCVVRAEALACSFCKKAMPYSDSSCKRCVEEHGVIKCVWEVPTEAVIAQVNRFLMPSYDNPNSIGIGYPSMAIN